MTTTKKTRAGDRRYVPCPIRWGRVAVYEAVSVVAEGIVTKRWDDIDAKGEPIGSPVGYIIDRWVFEGWADDPRRAILRAVEEAQTAIRDAETEIAARRSDIERLLKKRDAIGGDETGLFDD